MTTFKPSKMAGALAALALTGAMASAAVAGDVKLPKQMSWTAYGTTSSGYAQSVGIGQMLTKNYGTSLRIIPGKNDVSRMVPLRTGQTPLCACGVASYFAQEGVFMFASKKWGPMRLYNLFNAIGGNGVMAAVAGDAGIKTAADIRGKRVTWVKGSPALNKNMEAVLAFGGLTWDDVKKVVVPGWKQSAEAVISGQADVTFGTTVSGAYNKLAASPRGIYWLNYPKGDTDGWARAKAVAPHWAPRMISVGIKLENNASGQVPWEGTGYPYPIFVATDKLTASTGYGLTKAVMDNYEQIKDAGPSMSGYKIENQNFSWVFPYHASAIEYYKEKGVWTAEHDKNNAQLLKRQDVLADAWAKMDMDLADTAFVTVWHKVRAEALEAAGMSVPFR